MEESGGGEIRGSRVAFVICCAPVRWLADVRDLACVLLGRMAWEDWG